MGYERNYEQNLRVFKETMELKESDYILVGNEFISAQIAYAGGTALRTMEDDEYLYNEVTKFYRDFEIDILTYAMPNPLEAIWKLNRSTYFVSKDGVTVQHKESAPMREDEYPALIADPVGFIVDTILPRKFPQLLSDREKGYQLLRETALAYQHHLGRNAHYAQILQDQYGVVRFSGGKMYPPFDVIFDRLRGIVGTLTDMRRQPEMLLQACSALMPLYKQQLAGLSAPIPMGYCTVHAPTYLSNAQWEKFFWPQFREMILYCYEKGSKATVNLQGKWMRFLPYFKEIPKGTLRIQIEEDDPIEAVRAIGEYHTVETGIPIQFYLTHSKQECLDYAKEICDACAPGGGFIFSMDKYALSARDIQKENMQAVFRFVHEYH